jgi:hypothetical protein
MITIETIYSQLDEALNINDVSTVFSRDYMMDLVNQQRTLWLRNEYNKNKRSIDPNIIQDLGCVPLEVVDSVDCCEGIPLECKVLRTKCKIPNTVELYSKKAITRVGTIDLTQKAFNFIDYKRVPYSGTGRYGKDTIYAFLHNEYLYIYSKNLDVLLLEFITIRGIFEDPLLAAKRCLCNNTGDENACIDHTTSYPLNMWMWEYIRPVILDQLMKKQLMPLDQTNDTKDNKTEIGK